MSDPDRPKQPTVAFLKMMKILSLTFEYEVTDELNVIYWSVLKEYSDEVIAEITTLALKRNSAFMPKPGELHQLGVLPSFGDRHSAAEMDAWRSRKYPALPAQLQHEDICKRLRAKEKDRMDRNQRIAGQ